MRWLVFIALLAILLPCSARAQNENLDIVAEPICFAIVNTANYGVNGRLITAKFTRPDGIETRHRSNFRLGAAGSINKNTGEPNDREEFCSYGPFMPNRQLELTLHTLFPVFACKTRIDYGEIVIKGQRRADDDGVETWAECFGPDGTKEGKPAE